MTAQQERRSQLAFDAIRYARGIIDVMNVVEQDGELITTQPGDRIALAQARFQAMTDRNEQLVPDAVPKTVIHNLEAVQVEEQECKRVIGVTLHVLDHALQTIEKERPVGQPGK